MTVAESAKPQPGTTPLSRVLLKISGEALLGSADYGIDPAILKRIAGEIRDVMARGPAWTASPPTTWACWPRS